MICTTIHAHDLAGSPNDVSGECNDDEVPMVSVVA
jgi:hypothetical protein